MDNEKNFGVTSNEIPAGANKEDDNQNSTSIVILASPTQQTEMPSTSKSKHSIIRNNSTIWEYHSADDVSAFDDETKLKLIACRQAMKSIVFGAPNDEQNAAGTEREDADKIRKPSRRRSRGHYRSRDRNYRSRDRHYRSRDRPHRKRERRTTTKIESRRRARPRIIKRLRRITVEDLYKGSLKNLMPTTCSAKSGSDIAFVFD